MSNVIEFPGPQEQAREIPIDFVDRLIECIEEAEEKEGELVLISMNPEGDDEALMRLLYMQSENRSLELLQEAMQTIQFIQSQKQ